jgi:hypothetical protein
MEYLLILSNELGYMKQTDFDLFMKNINELKQMLIALLKKDKTKKIST